MRRKQTDRFIKVVVRYLKLSQLRNSTCYVLPLLRTPDTGGKLPFKIIDVERALYFQAFYKKNTAEIPSQAEITPYLSGQRMPACPAGGTYRIKRVGKYPSCSLWQSGHTLNNINMDEDSDPD